MDAYTAGERPTGIPVGLYAAGGLESPVYLDCRLPARPRGGAPQHHRRLGARDQDQRGRVPARRASSRPFPAHKGSVAALCFNVKGPDLCFLDQPGDARRARTAGSTSGSGSRPSRSQTVRYYAPFKADGVNLNTLRTHEALAANTEPLVWGLREVLDYAEVLLNRDDIDAKADAFIDFLAERVVGREFRTTCCAAGRSRCRASPTSRSSSAPSSISWRCWAGAARCGAPITSPPSGRCATGSATSAPAPRAW